MRIEDFERRENEDNKEYFTRVAAMLRELKDAGNDDDFDLAYSVVYKELCPIIKEVIECESRFYHLDDSTTYGYLKKVDDVISKTFHRYNDTEHLKDKTKQYGIRSFIKNTTKYCMRNALASTLCISHDRCRTLLKIRKVREELSQANGLDWDNVSVDMIYAALGGQVKKSEITELLRVEKGFVSLEQAQENGEQLDAMEGIPDSVYGNDLPDDAKEELDRAFAKLSKLDLYILVKDFGILDEEIRRMEMCDFVITPLFKKFMAEDDSIRSKSDPLKTAYNKKSKVMRVLAELNGRISMDDVEGCLTLYIQKLWEQVKTE